MALIDTGRLIVQKYGGTSLESTSKIKVVAQKIVETKRRGHDVVVVVSAMGNATDRLVSLARELNADPQRRELDVLLSTGEQTSVSLVAMAVHALGENVISLTGGQCGVCTNNVHANARILEIRTARLRSELALGRIVIVAGFQGISSSGETTTLGRGGSDTTAAALAAALDAHACQIFTDVESVYSADPRKVPGVRPRPVLRSEEMQEMAWHGAAVLKAEAVEFARTNGVEIEVRSTFGDGPGSRILVNEHHPPDAVFRPRRPAVAGVAGRSDLFLLSFKSAAFGAQDWEGLIGCIAGYDLVFGRFRYPQMELLISCREVPDVHRLCGDLEKRFKSALRIQTGLGAASLIGFGLGSRPEALWSASQTLAEAEIAIHDGFTGRESLSFLVNAEKVDLAVRCLHQAFVEKQPSFFSPGARQASTVESPSIHEQ